VATPRGTPATTSRRARPARALGNMYGANRSTSAVMSEAAVVVTWTPAGGVKVSSARSGAARRRSRKPAVNAGVVASRGVIATRTGNPVAASAYRSTKPMVVARSRGVIRRPNAVRPAIRRGGRLRSSSGPAAAANRRARSGGSRSAARGRRTGGSPVTRVARPGSNSHSQVPPVAGGHGQAGGGGRHLRRHRSGAAYQARSRVVPPSRAGRSPSWGTSGTARVPLASAYPEKATVAELRTRASSTSGDGELAATGQAPTAVGRTANARAPMATAAHRQVASRRRTLTT